MRTLYFLLPGTTGKFSGGGLWAELKIIELARNICPTKIVTYRQQEEDKIFLADLMESVNRDDCIFVLSWGFDVPKLISQLQQYHLIYHAHSANYGFKLPSKIPIITVSRNTMGYWGAKSPNSLIYYLPNQLGKEFVDTNESRDIDVLVQTRKSSQYLLKQLIPALQARCRVEIIDGYVEDIAAMFNRSKVYLYDSAEYWQVNGVTEGFGLPPLEALACGCNVFSSLNHALADYLDPGFNCHKIACYSLEYDLERILAVIKSNNKPTRKSYFWQQYSVENLTGRLTTILKEINLFFDRELEQQSSIYNLDFWYLQQLKVRQIVKKIQKKLEQL